ncbi:MAG: hypothetical protein HN593_01200 [Lentimicrobiaceae bacterium]|jgi:uncharacterized membrane protein YagU involved in acid resistance|nr:hypothetical protein [Lentimicrobiaceae bacterium]MBT6250742.1 hypothetical protein [Nitrosomonadales bacterium]MBT5163796.1 hypothetical protein [Lentimicrobiaceae bacterium]MBT6962466.1 hypothetical protein [Lentimicrobiaceae bacterium]MBT7317220.1 hypothetical protein [Lentimicrobiaceae bacterium]
MNTKIQKTILAGIIGTAIMSVVMMVAPMMGMPKMSPPNMLAGMLGMPVFVGWVMHFMIGIIFAFAYTYLCIFKHKISNVWLKGAVFGIIAFVFAQIMMGIMGMMMPMPKMEGSMVLMAIGSLMGHIIFGMAVAKTVGETYCSSETRETKTK